MKKNLLLTIIALISSMAMTASPVVLRRRALFQHGSMRMPSTTQVEADYNNGTLTVNIQNYTGVVWVYIYDADGNAIEEIASNITGNGTVAPDINFLNKGDYTLSIVLSGATYEGSFQIP